MASVLAAIKMKPQIERNFVFLPCLWETSILSISDAAKYFQRYLPCWHMILLQFTTIRQSYQFSQSVDTLLGVQRWVSLAAAWDSGYPWACSGKCYSWVFRPLGATEWSLWIHFLSSLSLEVAPESDAGASLMNCRMLIRRSSVPWWSGWLKWSPSGSIVRLWVML